MAKEQFMVISYDIPNDKRRLKIAKMLLDFGGERVQWSVFECYILPKHLERLRAKMAKVLELEEDSVRFYTLCEACRPRVDYVGKARAIDEPGLIII